MASMPDSARPAAAAGGGGRGILATRVLPRPMAALNLGECSPPASAKAPRQGRAAAATPAMRAARGVQPERTGGLLPSSARPPGAVCSVRPAVGAGQVRGPLTRSRSEPEDCPSVVLGCRTRGRPANGVRLAQLLRRPYRRTEGSGSDTTPTIALKQRVYLGHWSFTNHWLSSLAWSQRRSAAALWDQPQRRSGEGATTVHEDPQLPTNDHRVLSDKGGPRLLPCLRQGAPSSMGMTANEDVLSLIYNQRAQAVGKGGSRLLPCQYRQGAPSSVSMVSRWHMHHTSAARSAGTMRAASRHLAAAAAGESSQPT